MFELFTLKQGKQPNKIMFFTICGEFFAYCKLTVSFMNESPVPT